MPRAKAKWLRVPAGHDQERETVAGGDGGAGVDGAVAAGDADHLDIAVGTVPGGGLLEHRLQVVAVLELDYLGLG